MRLTYPAIHEREFVTTLLDLLTSLVLPIRIARIAPWYYQPAWRGQSCEPEEDCGILETQGGGLGKANLLEVDRVLGGGDG